MRLALKYSIETGVCQYSRSCYTEPWGVPGDSAGSLGGGLRRGAAAASLAAASAACLAARWAARSAARALARSAAAAWRSLVRRLIRQVAHSPSSVSPGDGPAAAGTVVASGTAGTLTGPRLVRGPQLHPVNGLVAAGGHAHAALAALPGGDDQPGSGRPQVFQPDGPGLAVLLAAAAAEALAVEGRQVHPIVEGGLGGGFQLFQPLVEGVAEGLDPVVRVVLEHTGSWRSSCLAPFRELSLRWENISRRDSSWAR